MFVFPFQNRGVPEEPELAQLVGRMIVAPTPARRTLMNNLIRDLKAAGLWTKFDCFYMLCSETEQQGLLNWIDAVHDCTKHGTVTYTIDRGFQGDGATGYLDTHYNPETQGIKYISDSQMGMGLCIATESNANAKDIGHCWWYIHSRNGADNRTAIYRYLGTIITVANTSSIGYFDFTYSIPTNPPSLVTFHKNSIASAGTLSGNSFPPNGNLYICGVSTIPEFSPRQIRYAYFGGNLTNAEVIALHNLVETYLDAIGAGVIP